MAAGHAQWRLMTSYSGHCATALRNFRFRFIAHAGVDPVLSFGNLPCAPADPERCIALVGFQVDQ